MCSKREIVNGRGQSLKEQLDVEIKRLEKQQEFFKTAKLDQIKHYLQKLEGQFDTYKDYLYDSENDKSLSIMKQPGILIVKLKKCQNKDEAELKKIVIRIKEMNDIIENNLIKNKINQDVDNFVDFAKDYEDDEKMKMSNLGFAIGARLIQTIIREGERYEKNIKALK